MDRLRFAEPTGCRRLVVLASGNGSNLQAIIDAAAAGVVNASVVAVVSNNAEAVALDRARSAGIDTCVIERHEGEGRPVYDARLAAATGRYQPDFVVLAGWMRILTAAFLDHFRVVNLHPALPGEFPGLHAIERAYADARAGRRTHTGVMVHFVPDEGVDDGPVIATAPVPIEPTDDLATLTQRVHTVEHRVLVEALGDLCADLERGGGADRRGDTPLPSSDHSAGTDQHASTDHTDNHNRDHNRDHIHGQPIPQSVRSMR